MRGECATNARRVRGECVASVASVWQVCGKCVASVWQVCGKCVAIGDGVVVPLPAMTECPKCGAVFGSARDLRRHLERKRPCDAAPPPSVWCEFCGRGFSSSSSLSRHRHSRCAPALAVRGRTDGAIGGREAAVIADAIRDSRGPVTINVLVNCSVDQSSRVIVAGGHVAGAGAAVLGDVGAAPRPVGWFASKPPPDPTPAPFLPAGFEVPPDALRWARAAAPGVPRPAGGAPDPPVVAAQYVAIYDCVLRDPLNRNLYVDPGRQSVAKAWLAGSEEGPDAPPSWEAIELRRAVRVVFDRIAAVLGRRTPEPAAARAEREALVAAYRADPDAVCGASLPGLRIALLKYWERAGLPGGGPPVGDLPLVADAAHPSDFGDEAYDMFYDDRAAASVASIDAACGAGFAPPPADRVPALAWTLLEAAAFVVFAPPENATLFRDRRGRLLVRSGGRWEEADFGAAADSLVRRLVAILGVVALDEPGQSPFMCARIVRFLRGCGGEVPPPPGEDGALARARVLNRAVACAAVHLDAGAFEPAISDRAAQRGGEAASAPRVEVVE